MQQKNNKPAIVFLTNFALFLSKQIPTMRNYLHYFTDIHSLLRYLVLLSTFIAATQSLIGLLGKKNFGSGNRKGALFMLIICDVQLLAGLAVYYLSGQLININNGVATKGRYNLFYSIEHPVSMLLAIILVHMGYAAVKKVSFTSEQKFKRLFWYSFIALFIFVAQTPWPNKQIVGKPWFSVSYPTDTTGHRQKENW